MNDPMSPVFIVTAPSAIGSFDLRYPREGVEIIGLRGDVLDLMRLAELPGRMET